MDGQELTGLPAWQRARAGLFLALQHPVEVPGVGLHSLLAAAGRTRRAGRGDRRRAHAGAWTTRPRRSASTRGCCAARSTSTSRAASGSAPRWSSSACSGPPICVLDEIDSGLDVDALGEVARRLQHATTEWDVGILAITHFNRFLVQLEADLVHVMVDGRIVATGDAALALQLERTGYAGYQDTR